MKAVLIDLDVIAEYDEDAPLRAAHKAIKTKLMVSFDRFKKLYGISEDEVLYETETFNHALIFQRLVEKTHNRAEPDLVLKIYKSFINAFLSRVKPHPDAAAFLMNARKAGMHIALLTDYSSATTLRIIERLGLGRHIDCIISNEEAKHAMKFLLAASKLGMATKDVAFIGAGAWDMHGANLAQMRTVIVARNVSPEFKGDSRPEFHLKRLAWKTFYNLFT